MPPSFRERAKYIPDFAKHGFMDLDESAEFDPVYAEGLMLVSIDRHAEIFGRRTALMGLYWARTFSEHPSWTGEIRERFPQGIIDSGILQDVARGSRKQCLDSCLPLFKAAFASSP